MSLHDILFGRKPVPKEAVQRVSKALDATIDASAQTLQEFHAVAREALRNSPVRQRAHVLISQHPRPQRHR